MEKTFDELEFRDDFMFGVIMRNPIHCKHFLETVLGIRISHIEYPKSQKTIDISADAKSVRLDVYVEDGCNTVYNIEMQAGRKDNLPKRMRYYQGMIDLNILEKGGNYRGLKRSYVIFVCTFDLFGEGRHIYTFENRCIQNTALGLGDDTVKVILNTKGTRDDIGPEMKRLLDFIDGKGPGDDFTRKLDEAVRAARKNEKWRLDYMTLQMSYDEKFEQGLKQGLEQGVEQGLEQGLEQGKLLAAKQMIRTGKLSAEEVALCSGLPLKRVSELENEIMKNNS